MRIRAGRLPGLCSERRQREVHVNRLSQFQHRVQSQPTLRDSPNVPFPISANNSHASDLNMKGRCANSHIWPRDRANWLLSRGRPEFNGLTKCVLCHVIRQITSHRVYENIIKNITNSFPAINSRCAKWNNQEIIIGTSEILLVS